MRKTLVVTALAALCGSLLLTIDAQAEDQTQKGSEALVRDLNEVARVASVMVDGDVCRRIMTDRAIGYLLRTDPRDPWAASDNFDVRHEAYIATKKTLIRLSRLVPYACDVNLWMPVPGEPGKIQVLIRNVNEWSQFWTWGVLTQETPTAMKQVLETGRRETVMQKPGMVSVLAPIFDSLGDTVGLVEVVAFEPDVAPPQVHARTGGAPIKEAYQASTHRAARVAYFAESGLSRYHYQWYQRLGPDALRKIRCACGSVGGCLALCLPACSGI